MAKLDAINISGDCKWLQTIMQTIMLNESPD